MKCILSFASVYFFVRVYDFCPTQRALLLCKWNANVLVYLEQHPKFQMQAYSKLVLSILLKVESMQNRHVRSVLQVKRFNKQFLLYYIDVLWIQMTRAKFQSHER